MFRFLFSILVFWLIGALILLAYIDFEPLHQWRYDLKTNQKAILTYKDIDKVLQSIEKVAVSDLPDSYLTYSKYQHKKYKKIVKNQDFYFIKGNDKYRFLVDEYRVRDFVTKDKLLKRFKKSEQYMLLDKKLLYKLLALKLALKEKGYDPNGFKLTSAFRHPRHNEEIGGASQSRHIYGQAIDITVKDVDKNGIANQKDKKIILDLLEKEIIKDKGGIGRYPNSMSVHFDTRGYRARWDSH